MNCKKCGNEISEKQKYCSQCGNHIETKDNISDAMSTKFKKTKFAPFVSLLLLLLPLLSAIMGIVSIFTYYDGFNIFYLIYVIVPIVFICLIIKKKKTNIAMICYFFLSMIAQCMDLLYFREFNIGLLINIQNIIGLICIVGIVLINIFRHNKLVFIMHNIVLLLYLLLNSTPLQTGFTSGKFVYANFLVFTVAYLVYMISQHYHIELNIKSILGKNDNSVKNGSFYHTLNKVNMYPMNKQKRLFVGISTGVLIVILIISTISMRTNSNINTSNLKKAGTFVTLELDDDGRYYGVDIFGSTKRGPKVYEFNNGYFLQKDDDNLNVEDSYKVSIIDENTFIVTDEDGFEDATLTIGDYDSSRAVLEFKRGEDIIYCYPYDYVDLENTTRESDSKYFSYKNYKYYVSLK